ncbi:MAG: hypothetical protein WC750_02415 [Patescibacteria group bacterium]
MPATRFEILPPQPEVSKSPSDPRYTRYKPADKPAEGVIGYESDRDVDLDDLTTFEVNNPLARQHADDVMHARVHKQEATGVTIDLVHLKILTDRIAKGLSQRSNTYLSIYQFIADKDFYETLLSYLEHLSKLKVKRADEIKQQVSSYQGLKKDQVNLLLKYLLERDKYLE